MPYSPRSYSCDGIVKSKIIRGVVHLHIPVQHTGLSSAADSPRSVVVTVPLAPCLLDMVLALSFRRKREMRTALCCDQITERRLLGFDADVMVESGRRARRPCA